MQTLVKERLNNRLNVPSVNGDKGIVHEVGDKVDFSNLVKGDRINGSEIWLKKIDASFAWSGGTSFTPNGECYFKENPNFSTIETALELNLNKNYWWLNDFQIPEIWKTYRTLGENVTIAILDTGIPIKHNHLNYDLIAGWDYVNNTNDYFDYGMGHGCEVAGIIAAIGSSALGVAPNVSLFVCKTKIRATQANIFIKALNKIASSNIDVIVISYNIAEEDINDLYAFNSAINENKQSIIVASVGNDKDRTKIQKSTYPSHFVNVQGIGSCTRDKVISDYSTKCDDVKLVAPGENVKSIGNTENEIRHGITGTSYAAPFTAGILALGISHLRKINRQIKNTEIVNALLSTVDTPDTADEKLYGKGIINPMNFIKKITQ